MKRKVMALVIVLFSLMISGSVFAEGYLVTSDLRIRAVINTVEKGPIDAVFYNGGEKNYHQRRYGYLGILLCGS